jgi:hypothetical protein
MRCNPRVVSRNPGLPLLGLAALAFATGPGTATAGLLDPNAFASLGTFPTQPGIYTYNTVFQTLNTPGGPLFHGVSSGGITVFTFDSLGISAGMILKSDIIPGVFGQTPSLALLSKSDVDVGGIIDVSGKSAGGGSSPAAGGPGGGPSVPGGISVFDGPGSGGSPGSGGDNTFPGAAGGSNTSSLSMTLLGGGGGGSPPLNHWGGGGGGAVEIGAIGRISISGSILAGGGTGLGSGAPVGAGGGGAGGSIFVHGSEVVLSGVLSAPGGAGGPSFGGAGGGGGGGGGGGTVLIAAGPGGVSDLGALIDVSGGPGGLDSSSRVPPAPGQAGVVTIVPEPSSLTLLGLGAFSLLCCGRWRASRPAPG